MSPTIISKLKPHQFEPVRRLHAMLREGINCVDLSSTGTGKTYVAAAVATELSLPTLVVGPKIARFGWEKAMEHFGERFSYINYESLRTGKTLFGHWRNPPVGNRQTRLVCDYCQCNVDIENFTPCYTHPRGIHCVTTKKIPHSHGPFSFSPEVRFLIFDEVHRCGAVDSLNADMLYAARRQGILTLGLSATAACSPLQMKSLGFVLGLHGGDERNIEAKNWQDWGCKKNFWAWAQSHGIGKLPALPGYRWIVGKDKQREVMTKIHADIVPSRGVRVKVEDIPGFPKRHVTAELYDISDPEKINALYREMSEPLGVLAKRREGDVAPDSAITKQLRARQQVELLKVPVFVELAEDYIAKGYSVAIFVNFTQTIDELCKRLKTDCKIDGRQNHIARSKAVRDFQDDATRTIVIQNAAGGIALSLPDERGEFPRVGLVSCSFSASELIQILGRLHRESSKSACFYRLIFAARTVEAKMQKAVDAKRDNLDSLNDGDLRP
jgi:Mimiviridae putative ATP-dependent RNA helicase